MMKDRGSVIAFHLESGQRNEVAENGSESNEGALSSCCRVDVMTVAIYVERGTGRQCRLAGSLHFSWSSFETNFCWSG